MQDGLIKYHIEGPGANDVANEISRIINEEIGIIPKRLMVDATDTGEVMRGDPIAATALILSIPSAILAATDLVERIKKRRRLDAVLDRSQRLVQSTSIKVRITTPDGTTLELNATRSADLLGPESE